jgi:glycosyltransferase involved in cell wall biosynthesis
MFILLLNMKHFLIIASNGPSLINFRLPFIKKLISKGFIVSVAAAKDNFPDNLLIQLQELKINIYFFYLQKTGLNFFQDCRSMFEIYKILKKSKPDLVLAYTVKAVIYAGILVKFFKKIKYYPLITGLGYIFIDRDSIKHKILNKMVIALYKFSSKSATKIIFQNKDDQYLFFKLKIIKQIDLSNVVNGSGIDLNIYPLSVLPTKPIFLMISRLLVDKGVKEYVEAAKIVKSRYVDVRFQLVGYLDENPSSITSQELQSWINQGNIEYLGKMDSVQSILKSCKYYVLPSYREGVPRSTLEALATGRPIITTDTPGCRETVCHKKNGLLVPIKDSKALAHAMISLLEESDQNIKKMAYESYLLAKNKFEIDKVNKSMLKIMNL